MKSHAKCTFNRHTGIRKSDLVIRQVWIACTILIRSLNFQPREFLTCKGRRPNLLGAEVESDEKLLCISLLLGGNAKAQEAFLNYFQD